MSVLASSQPADMLSRARSNATLDVRKCRRSWSELANRAQNVNSCHERRPRRREHASCQSLRILGRQARSALGNYRRGNARAGATHAGHPKAGQESIQDACSVGIARAAGVYRSVGGPIRRDHLHETNDSRHTMITSVFRNTRGEHPISINLVAARASIWCAHVKACMCAVASTACDVYQWEATIARPQADRGNKTAAGRKVGPQRTCSVPRAEMHDPLAPSVTMAMSQRGPRASAACSAVRPSVPSRAAASDLSKRVAINMGHMHYNKSTASQNSQSAYIPDAKRDREAAEHEGTIGWQHES